jgi:hypothetical protein
MLRKVLLSSVAALGLFSPLAVTTADAHPERWAPRHEVRYEHFYRVEYRDPCRPGWVCAGNFRDRREAERVAESYRCRHFEVFIR